jgi:hypothetical protein
MAQPSQEEAISILEEGNAKLRELLQNIPEPDLIREATIGGGEWSAKDLIGHISTWEEVAIRSLEEWRRGEVPWVEQDGGPFTDPGNQAVDAINARTVEEKRRLSLEEVRRSGDEGHRRLVNEIRSLSEDEWRAQAFYPTEKNRRRRLVTLLGAILGAPGAPFGHAFAHIPDVVSFAASVRDKP